MSLHKKKNYKNESQQKYRQQGETFYINKYTYNMFFIYIFICIY